MAKKQALSAINVDAKAYEDALAKIVQTIELAQVKTMMAANSQFLWAYWNIGNELSARITGLVWGAKVIDNLSRDIRRKFPFVKGFSSRNLLYIRQFAETYPPEVIVTLNQFWLQTKSNMQQVVALIQSPSKFSKRLFIKEIVELA